MHQENVVKITQNYYDSLDADTFYFNIWGGEDIHVGIYQNAQENIFDAGRRIVEEMVSLLQNIDSSSRILDMGSGYGGAARYLAKRFGCKIYCLNLHEKGNERNREKNKEQGLSHLIHVIQGNFEEIPFENNFFDLVWSEDAILHSANKEQVFKEVARVLRPQGEFIFTDPMQSDNCPPGVLQDVLARIHLDSMGSFKLYKTLANNNQLQKINIVDLSPHLVTHYYRVHEELSKKYDEMIEIMSKAYVDKMLLGLQHWINAGKNNHLSWGILHFKKS